MIRAAQKAWKIKKKKGEKGDNSKYTKKIDITGGDAA